MNLTDAIRRAVDGANLSRAEADEIVDEIMSGRATDAQIGGWLIALRMKGETIDEIVGAALAMRSYAQRVDVDTSPLVDTCGTGGDSGNSFNISTCAAFVVAGAGVAVAKHGNRSVSSRCGSADVLEALGVQVALTPEQVGDAIREFRVGFLFAPAYHGAMKYAIGPRRQIGVRTIFNLLGPLTNPAGADVQIVGVYDRSWVEPLARVLVELGCRSGFVVHGAGGLDEISLLGSTTMARIRNGDVQLIELDPARDLGLQLCRTGDIEGGEPETNARIFLHVLEGRPGPRRDIVVLNAAAALLAADAASDWREALSLAAASIDSGAARDCLYSLRHRFPRGAPL